MERYTAMYPCGQPGLPNDPVMAYINNLCVTGTAPGSTTAWRTWTTRRHDPTREWNVYVASASSSTEPEPAPRHRNADAQWRARLDELAEERRQLDEELALLYKELGMDAEPRDRRPMQDVPVQGEPPPPRGTTTGTSAARLPISPAAAHLRRRRVGCRATTTNATTRARTSTLMPTLALTLTLRHSSGGRLRTLLLRPCCYAAAQSSRPPRSDECANS
jgi:hypothetical protein